MNHRSSEPYGRSRGDPGTRCEFRADRLEDSTAAPAPPGTVSEYTGASERAERLRARLRALARASAIFAFTSVTGGQRAAHVPRAASVVVTPLSPPGTARHLLIGNMSVMAEIQKLALPAAVGTVGLVYR
eukprot:COSAG02_NODE_872_length_16321_cov_6.491062_4_plen_130_part_00